MSNTVLDVGKIDLRWRSKCEKEANWMFAEISVLEQNATSGMYRWSYGRKPQQRMRKRAARLNSEGKLFMATVSSNVYRVAEQASPRRTRIPRTKETKQRTTTSPSRRYNVNATKFVWFELQHSRASGTCARSRRNQTRRTLRTKTRSLMCKCSRKGAVPRRSRYPFSRSFSCMSIACLVFSKRSTLFRLSDSIKFSCFLFVLPGVKRWCRVFFSWVRSSCREAWGCRRWRWRRRPDCLRPWPWQRGVLQLLAGQGEGEGEGEEGDADSDFIKALSRYIFSHFFNLLIFSWLSEVQDASNRLATSSAWQSDIEMEGDGEDDQDQGSEEGSKCEEVCRDHCWVTCCCHARANALHLTDSVFS